MSGNKLKYHLVEIIYVIVIWLLASLLFAYIKFNDMSNAQLVSVYDILPGMTKTKLYQLAILIGIFSGTFMGILHSFVYPHIIKARNFLVNSLLRIFVFSALALAMPIAFVYFNDGQDLYDSSRRIIINSPGEVFFYPILIEILAGAIITLRRNLGRNYFSNFVRNTYFTPKEEARVFLFLDMGNSTPLVEEMGNVFFSNLIQDCFKDLAGLTLDFGGELYQYVGDEAVITWIITRKFDYGCSVKLHYAFKKKLKLREEYYLGKYGVLPYFRSSIHCGKVSTALVGEYKTEIAYHGGVLNLCARLQSVCREYEAELILSEPFYKRAKDMLPGYKLLPITNITLKGISSIQKAYQVIVNQAPLQ
jgi:adenylate cyclase